MVVFGALAYLILCIVVANVGSEKEIGSMNSFLVCLFFSPLIGILIVIASAPKSKNSQTRKTVNKRVVNLTSIAEKKYKKGEFNDAIATLNKALLIDPNERQTHYNLSSLYSVLKNKEKAFYHLEKAVENGYSRFSKINNSTDFEWLKSQPEFPQFVSNGYKLSETIDIENNYLEDLEKLAQLKEKGVLTEEEFREEKRKILERNN